MSPFTHLFAPSPRPRPDRKGRAAQPVRLGLESLEDRWLLSASPLTLASNHNLMYGSTVVLPNVEQYQWSPATNVGYALQQGGKLQTILGSAPTRVKAVIGTSVESFALSSSGSVYDLHAGGLLQYSANSGSFWSALDNLTESFALSANGALYDLDAGGGLWVLPAGGYWSMLDNRTESFALSADGTLYDLDAGGQLRALSAGGYWAWLDNDTESFAVTSGGALYNLLTNGTLETSADVGTTWTALDNQTESFALALNGTLYDLDAGGQLWALPAAGWWAWLDNDTASFAVTPGGTIANLRVGGTLESSVNGTTWTNLDGTAQSFALTANGTLDALNTGGALRQTLAAAANWTTLNATGQVFQSFALTPNATLYTLDTTGALRAAGSSTPIDPLARSFAVTPDGTVYELDTAGRFWVLPVGGTRGLFDDDTQSFVVSPNGELFNLHVGGGLYDAAEPTDVMNPAWNYLDYCAVSIGMSGSGTLYVLDTGNALFTLADDGSWPLLDTSTQSFTVSPNGMLYDLDPYGQLWALPPGEGWQWLFGNTTSYALSGNGTLFALTGGVLESSTNAGASWNSLVTNDRAFDLTPNGTLENLPATGLPKISTNAGSSWSDWITSAVPNAGLASLVRTDLTRDGALTRADLLGLFTQAEGGGTVTAAELTSLQALVGSAAVPMPDALRNLAGKVVNGSPADALFQRQALGDLAPNAPSGQMANLVQKWFYGADHPLTDPNPANNLPFGYALAQGALFGPSGMPSYDDVAQGWAADCYFMSSLGQLAVQSPAVIQSMITDNGDGTYTVRFYDNGVADYVTVDRYLPVASDGSFVYANCDQYGQATYLASTSNVLWVALVEKAYTQLVEEGWCRAYAGQSANAYASIGYGSGRFSICQLTGAVGGWTVVTDPDYATPDAETIIVQDIAAGHILLIGTLGTFPDDQTPFLTGHGYILKSYDPTTGLFTFINPYEDAGARVVQVTWQQMLPYVWGIDDITLPAGVSVTSVEQAP